MAIIQQTLKHTAWECKYHIVWIPKYRKKKLYKEFRQYLGEIFRDLALQKECQILEGYLMSDHIHILISIPPRKKKEFHRTKLLGKRLSCFNSRTG